MSRLNSIYTGQGPVLVMLHGLFGSLDNFRSVALHLERSASVLRIDLPGHGRSESLPSLSIEAMAEAVLDELEATDVKQFHLLGHSLGGKVALCMAGNPRCTGLQQLIVVDIAPKTYPPHHQDILDALQAIDLESLGTRDEADKLLRGTISDAGIRSFLLKSLYRHDSGRWMWRFDLLQLAKNYPLIAQAPTIHTRIEQPVLFIKGGNSDYLEAADEPEIQRVCAQPSLKIIGGAGHWPHAEKPAQFTRIVQEFIA